MLTFDAIPTIIINMIATVLKWIATIVALLGAIATTLKFDPLNIWLLNLAAFLFLIWGCLIRDKAMITVNAGMLLIYIFGIYVRT